MMKYFGLMPEETEAYRKLVKLFRTSMEITEVLTGLIDPTNKMQPLNDCSTKKLVCFSSTYIFFRCIRG
jgi:hypothetical protein